MTRLFVGFVMLAAMTATGCMSQPAAPPAAPVSLAETSYAPVVSLNEIMVYVVDPHSNEIWDAAMTPPKTDEGWKALQHASVAIAASGSLTRLSGNGPKDQQWTQQADWSRFSQAVADAGLAALQAVRARDVAALSKAGDQLNLSCINCHREYKLDVPKIWTERQFPPEVQK